MHTLYILTRGRIFSDEWNQHQSSALLRGLAAQLTFEVMAEKIGESRAQYILQNDWTTWNLRKIGTRFNPIQWEGENRYKNQYLRYKSTPDMRNIYWSTLLVQYMSSRYGPTFKSDLFEAFRTLRNKSLSEAEIFRKVTGEDLETVTEEFMKQS